MADPTDATTIPHIIGITLGGSPVAETQVVAVNRTTGDRLIKPTDADSRVIFDVSNFISGYSAGDVIEFENVGGSVGGTTVTITDATGGLQIATLTAAAAPTISISL